MSILGLLIGLGIFMSGLFVLYLLGIVFNRWIIPDNDDAIFHRILSGFALLLMIFLIIGLLTFFAHIGDSLIR